MAGIKDQNLTELHGWAGGLDNISRDEQLPIGKRGRDGKANGRLRVAKNIDIDDEGKVSRREGYELVSAYTDLHSIYAHKLFPYMLAVEDGNLVLFNTELTKTILTALTAPLAPMSWDFGAGYIYYSNGHDSGRVSPDGVLSPWSVELPTGQPNLSAAATGGLYAGTYQVAITFLDIDGRESGSTLAEYVDLDEGQGLQLSNIPQPVGNDVVAIRLYATTADGEALRFVRDLPVGATGVVIGVHQPGKNLETQFHEPLPAGEHIRIHNGRMYVMRGRVLYWSEALHYGQGLLASSYLAFNAPGTLLAPVSDAEQAGMFVAAGNRTYYLEGADPKQWKRRVVHPHGAVPGTLAVEDAQLLGLESQGVAPFWLDSDGQYVIGQIGGRVAMFHSDRFVSKVNVERGVTLYREINGLRQLISSLRGGTTSGLAVGDVVSAEIYKNGVRIG